MSTRTAKSQGPQAPRSTDRLISTYWDRVHWPLQGLYFLLPLLVIYEIGTVYYAPHGHQRLPAIWAESLLGRFFNLFGVTGYHLPGLVVVVVLLCWHLARRDPWRPQPALYVLMSIESLLLAIPLFVFNLALFRSTAPPEAVVPLGLSLSQSGIAELNSSWQAGLIFSIGAGIYEELLFRLIAIALLHLALVDVLALPEHYGAAGAILLSAIAFAAYHFLGETTFHMGKFLFYILGGIYLAAVYVLRGFGIVAATHALFDMLVVITSSG